MNKKYCIKCGKEIQSNAEFCPFCGTSQIDTTATGAGQSANTATANNIPLDTPYNENSNPNLLNSTKLFFTDSFKINKRMGRADYWWALLGLTLITAIVSFVFSFVISFIGSATDAYLDYNIDGSPTGATIAIFILLGIVIIYSIYIFIAGLTAQFRRFHDIALSGAFWLINFVPVVGSLAVLIMLLQPSKQQNNRYIQ